MIDHAPAGGPVGAVHLLRAFVWLRWRTLSNGISARRRSVGQRLGAIGSLIGRIVALLALGGIALIGAALGGFLPAGLVRLGTGVTDAGISRADGLLLVVRGLLGAFLVLVFMVPAIQGLAGGGLPRTRLLLLPVRLRTLHALEASAHLGDPWLLAVVPALVAAGIGALVVAGAGGLVVLVAGLLFVLAVAALSAAVTFGVGLLLRDRRRAEALAMVLFLGWIGVALLPSWLQSRDDESPETQPVESAEATEVRDPERDRLLRALVDPPAATWIVPSEAYSRALGLAVLGRPLAALLPTAALALGAALLFALSRLLWGRLIASPAASGGHRGAGGLPRPTRFPGLSDGASAVAWGQLRTLSRTLAGRMGLLGAPIVTAVLASMVRSDLAEVALGGRLLGSVGGAVVLGVGATALSLLSLQSFLVNQYALDGPGFSLSVLGPLSRRDHVAGKWAAGAILGGVLMLVSTGVVMALAPRAVPFWPALLLGGLGAYAVLAPLGSWVSLLLPRAVDLDRFGRDAQPNQLAVLASMLVTPLVAGVPFLAGGVAYVLTGSVLAVTAVEGLWLLAAAGLARLLLGPVARTLAGRQQAVYLALHERPGT